MQIKVTDFGTSMLIDPKGRKPDTSEPYFFAPEALLKQACDKSDIWSVGVITYMMLCGDPPFNGVDEYEITKSIRIGKFSFDGTKWAAISERAKDLISKMLAFKPSDRLSAEEALRHPWIDNLEI